MVPYQADTSTSNKQAILVSDNYAVLKNITLHGENYKFDAFFFYNEE
jgi:hypothetical protein